MRLCNRDLPCGQVITQRSRVTQILPYLVVSSDSHFRSRESGGGSAISSPFLRVTPCPAPVCTGKRAQSGERRVWREGSSALTILSQDQEDFSRQPLLLAELPPTCPAQLPARSDALTSPL